MPGAFLQNDGRFHGLRLRRSGHKNEQDRIDLDFPICMTLLIDLPGLYSHGSRKIRF